MATPPRRAHLDADGVHVLHTRGVRGAARALMVAAGVVAIAVVAGVIFLRHEPARTPLAADAPPAEAPADAARAGVLVFPPPGTKPIKRGIVVPDDFDLPPGYVRHFQTTDDGQMLAAILMFSPDYQLVNDRGEPVEVPADRVVPPEMAPPGLPIQMLDVPQQATPDRAP